MRETNKKDCNEKREIAPKKLSAVSKLSGLFSESAIPFINYRVAENIFCRSFDAGNLSRSDTAFDANYNSIGVGLKTFVCNSNNSNEKVAEFNSLSRVLSSFQGKDLAHKLAEFRNERIDLANRLYNIENSLYHIVARKNNELVLFETDYDKIDIKNIHSVKQNNASLQFEDGKNFYSFNYSKSTLFRKFHIPEYAFRLPFEILEDPYSLLLELFEDKSLKPATDKFVRGENYVILPLYGFKNKEKFVFEKSGLNQWNAGGRKRDFGEVYIPIPAEIHNQFPNFFPTKDELFELKIPTGEVFSAKVCQDNSKALMTNPNKALSDWLLRKVFQVKEGELLTIEKMSELGFDSVIICKDGNGNYQIDKAQVDSYEQFII
ncbi:restriction endonuclease [Chryseobacterium sp.]|uniref:restriction endonuclease n=1 Tax=Chryseobacterium sp. TaxID=1871047 RepID=UPI002FC9ACA4